MDFSLGLGNPDPDLFNTFSPVWVHLRRTNRCHKKGGTMEQPIKILHIDPDFKVTYLSRRAGLRVGPAETPSGK